MSLLEGPWDLPLKRLRDKTKNKIKYKQQALINTKIQRFKEITNSTVKKSI